MLTRKKLADGIYATCLDGEKFKVHSITLGVEIPLDLRTVTIANLLARILKRGCAKYPDMIALERKCDELYAADLSFSVTRSGESEYFCLFTDFLSDNYTADCDIISEITELIKEMLLFPKVKNGKFDPEYLKGEKKNLSDDIDALINNKAKYAKKRCIEELCKSQPYALPTLGDKEVLSSINADELYDFLINMLTHNRIEILYTGQKKQFDKVCLALTSLFSQINRDYIEHVSQCNTIVPKKQVSEISEPMEVNQGKLSIGLCTGITNTDSDIAGLIVANEIFGASPNSKLFMNVREKMSLCYYCSSGLDAVKGLMFINAGIEGNNYEVAKNAIFKQLEDVKNGLFSDEEFSNAINSLINLYKSVSDNVGSLETWYLPRIFRGENDTPDSRIAQISKVTREDVIRAFLKVTPEVIYFLSPQAKENSEVFAK